MLGHRLAGTASVVCLPCRLRLARGPKRAPFPAIAAALSLRAPQRYFSAYTGPNGDETKAQFHDETSADHSTDRDVELDSSDVFGQHDGMPAPWRPRPDKRIFNSSGQVVSPEREGLSVDMLGKPGAAIVMREQRTVRRKRQLPQLQAEETPVDPSTFIENDFTATDSQNVLLNLHELRPKETPVLTDNQFNKLADNLIGGFTSAQLEQYIAEYDTVRRLAQEESERPPERPPWLLKMEPWTPIGAGTSRDVEPHLAGYITKGMAPKKRLAIRLMRECWDASSRKILNKDGFLTMQLRDVEFELLTLGNRRWFEGTARAILALVKEVKLIRDTRTVSILAPKHAADSIFSRIHGVLSNARTSDFAADFVSPRPLAPGVLQEVGRVTNTVTRFDPSGKRVVVTWIHQEKRDENFENACETVLRFLRDAYGPKTRVSTDLVVVPSEVGQGGRYLPVLDSAPKLPWYERSAKWERWTAAISQRQGNPDAQEASIPADILPFDICPEVSAPGSENSAREVEQAQDAEVIISGQKVEEATISTQDVEQAHEVEPAQNIEEATSSAQVEGGISSAQGSEEATDSSPGGPSELTMDTPPGWSSELTTETCALFGHAAFARQSQAPSPSPPSESTAELDPSQPRTFIPALPPLSSLNLPSNLHETGLWHTTIVLRFAPSPELSADLKASAPDLELRMDADHKEVKALLSLRAINAAFTGDVLFPAAAVDARLTQQRYFNLPGPSIEHHLPPLITFLSKSDLRPWDGKLSTPSALPGVRLPRRLLSAPTTVDHSTTSATAAADGANNNNNNEDEVEIDYSFASVEIRRTVAGEYDGLKLRYTGIQGGQRGGERSELSLDAVPVDLPLEDHSRVHEPADPDTFDGFDAYDIVDEGTFREQFVSHSMNRPNNEATPAAPARRVELQEFLEAVSGIVNERGRLKWHAQR